MVELPNEYKGSLYLSETELFVSGRWKTTHFSGRFQLKRIDPKESENVNEEK